MKGRYPSDHENSKDYTLDDASVSNRAHCGFCFLEVEFSIRVTCPRCLAVYHPDCFKTNDNRCAIYGCTPTIKKTLGARQVPPVVFALVLTMVIGVVLVSLLVAGSRPTMRHARMASCANNLAQLWKMQQVYARQFGGPMKQMSEETGKGFWRTLTRTDPPLIDHTMMEIFLCPVKGDGAVGDFEYLGPIKPVHQLGDLDAVGGDDLKNHNEVGDNGHVLRKSGDVVEIPTSDWAGMVSKLKE